MGIIKQAKNIKIVVNKDYYVKAGAITEIADRVNIESIKENLSLNSNKKIIQHGENGGVKHGDYAPPEVKIEPSEYKLESTYAHDQMYKIAQELSEMTFVLIMMQIFGNEIEISALGKLYRDLNDKKIQSPEIIVSNISVGRRGLKVGYSNKRKKIIVNSKFLEEAIKNNENRAELMAALVEEYGHHIDNLLRTELATNGKKDKDIIDEGAKFAYYLLTTDFANTPTIDFAKAETPQYIGNLILDLSKESSKLSEYVNQKQWYDETPNQDIENFGFGFADGTHGGIEMKALRDIVFDYNEVLQIYYGNWLRDVSQVLVPFTIRFTKEIREQVEKNSPQRFNRLLAGNTAKLSHEGWVNLIELFAAKEFVYTMGGSIAGDVKGENYVPHLNLFRETYGQLTKDILGIYRPEEHIDNPKDLTDDRIGQTMFYREVPGGVEPWDFFAGESPDCFITNSYGQKYYIYRDTEDAQKKLGVTKEIILPDPLRPSSDTYMCNQIRLAIRKGKNKDGFRHLGAALHVLEDYFSHTNFVELSICKLGFTNPNYKHLQRVYPWVEKMQGKDYKTIPIVTGKFLLDDTVASIVPKMADMLFPIGFTDYELRKPGERTFGEQTIYTILKDMADGQKEDPTQNNEKYLGMDAVELFSYYEKLLELSDFILIQKSRKDVLGWVLRFWGGISHFLGEIMTNFTNIVFNLLIASVDDDIKETQTHATNVNYGENPTHTQIAKDVVTHPLNSLAAELARIAVEDIGQRIKTIWESQTSSTTTENELVNYILNTYSRHPRSVTWMEKPVLDWVKSKNQKFLQKLNYPTPIDHAHDIAKRKVLISKEKIEEFLKYFK